MGVGGGPGGLGYDDATQHALLFGGVPMGQQQPPHVYIRDDAFGLAALGLNDGAHGGGRALSSSAEVYKPSAASQPSEENDDENDNEDAEAATVRGDAAATAAAAATDDDDDDVAPAKATAAINTVPPRAALVPGKWNKTRVVHTQVRLTTFARSCTSRNVRACTCTSTNGTHTLEFSCPLTIG
jgi:hypothetical protein